ncbi:spinster family MFS transporter [Niveispirillum fermenti]|uniref:spinster family MFS transporter n=1 Tax=Niveispirillum fermenti TaxID=1233113 RepID=UPI003A84A5B6
MDRDSAIPAAGDADGHGTPGYRALVLAMLLLVYIFNFIDRQILGILAVPVKAELGLSDTQLGLLGGIAFALLYSTAAVPLGWLADRTSRTWVITGALVVWSGFTALCGVAQNFWTLFLCRLGVGVGEAGGVAPSFSLISSYFPARQRARALAVYSLGIPIGSALGVLFGGYIAAHIDWRAAFIVVGLAGVLLAPLFRLVVREPRQRQAATAVAADLRLGPVLATLARKPSFWLLAFGAASSSIVGYGLAFWVPSVLQRSFGLDLVGTSQFLGALLAAGGIAGVMLGGVLGDRVGAGNRRALALLPALSFLVAVPLFTMGIMSQTLSWGMFLLMLVPMALGYVWLAPVISAVQHLVHPRMRATAVASFLFINNLLGPGLGTFILGWMSDLLLPLYPQDGLRYAMLLSLGFYLLAALLMALAARTLPRDWVE